MRETKARLHAFSQSFIPAGLSASSLFKSDKTAAEFKRTLETTDAFQALSLNLNALQTHAEHTADLKRRCDLYGSNELMLASKSASKLMAQLSGPAITAEKLSRILCPTFDRSALHTRVPYNEGVSIRVCESAVLAARVSSPSSATAEASQPKSRIAITVATSQSALVELLLRDPDAIYGLAPDTFEELICDRFIARGFELRRVGATNRKDGGIDIFFWPLGKTAIPYLGVAQVKHHRSKNIHEGPRTVREFAGTLAALPINVGVIVTNTSFTPDARWFANERAKLIQFRENEDITRWLAGNFTDPAEWRDIPHSIEVCHNTIVKIR